MLALIDGLLISLFRRAFGEGKIKGLLGNRTFQALFFICFQTIFWCIKDNAFSWLTLAIAVYVYIMYFSRAVGAILDCGTAWWQKAKDYGRWWTKPLCWIIKKLGYEKYGKEYDFCWTICRYTLCLLPLIYFGHHIWVAGLFSAPIYYGCKELFAKYPELYTKYKKFYIEDYKDLAEYCVGFSSGCIFYIFW